MHRTPPTTNTIQFRFSLYIPSRFLILFWGPSRGFAGSPYFESIKTVLAEQLDVAMFFLSFVVLDDVDRMSGQHELIVQRLTLDRLQSSLQAQYGASLSFIEKKKGKHHITRDGPRGPQGRDCCCCCCYYFYSCAVAALIALHVPMLRSFVVFFLFLFLPARLT